MLVFGGVVVAAAAFYGCVAFSRATNPDYDLAETPRSTASEAMLADVGDATTVPVGEAGLGSTTQVSGSGRAALAGFAEARLTVTSPSGEQCELCALAATTGPQRARGLMEATDPELGGYDAMVFVYPDPTEGSFWMRNTPMPLTISYVDATGTVISEADMEPCGDVPSCESYPASGAFRFAIEIPRDRAEPLDIEVGSTVVIESFSCADLVEDS